MSSQLLRAGTITRVRVNPVVHLTVLDQYLRQASAVKRVYGVLLGTYVVNTLNITSCFAVPVTETEEELSIDPHHLEVMKTLHEQANPSEMIVGWYASGTEDLGADTSLLHASFESATEMENLMYMFLDTSFPGDKLSVKAFQPIECTLKMDEEGDEEEAAAEVEPTSRSFLFTPVPCEVLAYDSDRVALNALNRSLSATSAVTPLKSKLEGVMQSTDKLLAMVDKALNYVTQVHTTVFVCM
ncbi:hypothetical protein PTSG_07534 [Salpingoeca rosetta]|uniref:MPN domain-containing protein n=1 Tax=Salpingoeca rosetta (strain ATCC 50818 / BSB-021) TaxID=946362 RepID=F2UH16_SALR5|nr:uncharacterized protein PTSG_07534 [Salpingoeca rosetta]EGD76415.1 hypothetical protein PTSG_07534 [Salpingoeca rosetta]|eukprot:XP_004991330.1 hypothetical protein PTSG_07534 [Salpingoeca rosetta]